MKSNIKILVRESLVKVLTEQASNTDKQVIDYILGGGLNEADGGKMYEKFLKLLKSSKKGLITATVMTALMANTAFSAEISKAPDDVKNYIEQITQQSDFNDISANDSGEQEQSNFETPKDGDFTIKFDEVFKSGSYNLEANVLKIKLNELKEFLKNNNETSFDIVITASESQVPNQSGFGVGELAKKRASVLEKVINKFLTENGKSNTQIKIETRVGDVKWDGKNAHDAKYTKDQYVKLDLFVAGVSPCELDFSESGKVAGADNNYISHEQELDESGSLTINPGSIPDRMVITNSDGKIIADTGYFSDKKHQYQEYNYVPLYVANLSSILHSNPSAPAIQGLKSTTKSFKDFNELIDFIKKDKSFNINKDTRAETKNGIVKLKQLWDAGQREYIFYTLKKGNVNFELGNSTKAKMTVYSPIGKTGYSVKGSCD